MAGDMVAWFGQHPGPQRLSRFSSYLTSSLFVMHSKQNQANRQHRVQVRCYFGLNWCERRAAPAAVGSIHMEHEEEYIYSHSKLPREEPSLNAASRHLFTSRFSVFHTHSTVQMNLVHAVFYLDCYLYSWMVLNKDVASYLYPTLLWNPFSSTWVDTCLNRIVLVTLLSAANMPSVT